MDGTIINNIPEYYTNAMKKILIIDDHIDTLELLGFLMKSNEYEVVESQWSVAVEEIIEIKPDAVLIDCYLKDGFGPDLCRELKANPLTAHIPVILLSVDEELGHTLPECNANAFISKPFNISNVEKIVEDLLL